MINSSLKSTRKLKTLAVFDFDGTLTNRDSLNDFLLWRYGPIKFFSVYLIISPILFLYLLGCIKNITIKKIQIYFFLKESSMDSFLNDCEDYAKSRLKEIIRPEAISVIKQHAKKGHELIIISATYPFWIKHWASQYDFSHVLGTEIKAKKGKINCASLKKVCVGIEKVNRLMDIYPNLSQYEIYAYGDSYGDKHIMNMATHSYYKSFK